MHQNKNYTLCSSDASGVTLAEVEAHLFTNSILCSKDFAHSLVIGASLSEPHTSERFRAVSHSRSKMENYENSKYRSYSEPCHGVCEQNYHANSKYRSYSEPCHGVCALTYFANSKHVHGNMLPILNMDNTVNHTTEYVHRNIMPFLNIIR